LKFPDQNVASISHPLSAECPIHLILLDLITLRIWSEEYKLWSSSFVIFSIFMLVLFHGLRHSGLWPQTPGTAVTPEQSSDLSCASFCHLAATCSRRSRPMCRSMSLMSSKRWIEPSKIIDSVDERRGR
jgi:hypothetical protein